MIQKRPLDSEALTMAEIAHAAVDPETSPIIRLFEEWISREDDESIDVYRLRGIETCPGLVTLWERPFCAVYRAKDGQVLVRLESHMGKTIAVVECIPARLI